MKPLPVVVVEVEVVVPTQTERDAMSVNYISPEKAELPELDKVGRPPLSDTPEIAEMRATLDTLPGEWFKVAIVSEHREAYRLRSYLNRYNPKAKLYRVSARKDHATGKKIVYAQKVSPF